MNFDQINFQTLSSIIKERTNPFVFWCGAGLSVDAGLPRWTELKNNIINDFLKEAEEDEIPQIESIRNEKDLWTAFSRIKSILGNVKYHSYIRKYIDIKANPPEVYDLIWKLNPRGLVNLNLDRLATMSYTKEFPGEKLNEFIGYDLADHINLLRSPDKLIINLHGVVDNSKSWVFTKEDIKRLHNKPGFKEFIDSLFTSNAIVFLGISAEDIGAGGILHYLVHELQINLATHYWITDRNDQKIKDWAEKSNIGIIKYDSGKHDEISNILKRMLAFESKEPELEPIKKSTSKCEEEIEDDIEKLTPNETRYYLNKILEEDVLNKKPFEYEDYFNFLEENDEQIHKAWFIGKKAPKNKVFEYDLESVLGKGSFGKVFKGVDCDSNSVAVKILHEDILDDKEKLMCFRRGVKSHSILSNNKISNTVKLYDAAEIPLMIVMDYIEGPNLETLVESKFCTEWFDILKVSNNIASVLLSAHNLPERVLHRDLRPSNIMFDKYYENGDLNVILTDFDFSWHKGAIETSISRTPAGFLAPEQIETSKSFSTRSALVDSYAFGMNLFYIISQIKPLYKNHLHNDWDLQVTDSSNAIHSKQWKSIPNRFARLITDLTKDKQNERWDITQAKFELERLLAVESKGVTNYAELLSEELMLRSINSNNYSLNDSTFSYNFTHGLLLSLSFNEVTKSINLVIGFQRQGFENFNNIKKYLPTKREKTISTLKSLGWKILNESKSSEHFNIQFTIGTEKLMGNLEENSIAVREIKNDFNF